MPDDPDRIYFARFWGDQLVMHDKCRRENEALRQMLIDKGLTPAQIRRGVKRRTQSLEPFEEAAVLCRRVCEEMQKWMQENDPLEQFAKTLPKKDLKEMS